MDRILDARSRAVRVLNANLPEERTKIEDFVLGRLSGIVVDALDCVFEQKPFESLFLNENNTNNVIDCIKERLASHEVRNPSFLNFANSLIVLFTEMEGTTFGRRHSRNIQMNESQLTAFPEHTLLISGPNGQIKLDTDDSIDTTEITSGEAEVKIEEIDVKEEDNHNFSNEGIFDAELMDYGNTNQSIGDIHGTPGREQSRGGSSIGKIIINQGSTLSHGGNNFRSHPAKRFRCKLCCNIPPLFDLDAHFEEFHREIWMKEDYKCRAMECDFRSVNAAKLQDHELNFVAHYFRAGYRDYYGIRQDIVCPYCSQHLSTIGEYTRHVAECHRLMISSNTVVHICGTCEFKSVRVYQMIQHWSEGSCKCLMRLDWSLAEMARLKYRKSTIAPQKLSSRIDSESRKRAIAPKQQRQNAPIMSSDGTDSESTANLSPSQRVLLRAENIIKQKPNKTLFPAGAPIPLTIARVEAADSMFAVLHFNVKVPQKDIKCPHCTYAGQPGLAMDQHIAFAHSLIYKRPVIRCSGCPFKTIFSWLKNMHDKELLCTVCGWQMSLCSKETHVKRHPEERYIVLESYHTSNVVEKGEVKRCDEFSLPSSSTSIPMNEDVCEVEGSELVIVKGGNKRKTQYQIKPDGPDKKKIDDRVHDVKTPDHKACLDEEPIEQESIDEPSPSETC